LTGDAFEKKNDNLENEVFFAFVARFSPGIFPALRNSSSTSINFMSMIFIVVGTYQLMMINVKIAIRANIKVSKGK